MRKNIAVYQMIGFIFVSIAGTILHFVFDWTGGSIIAALFSAVNESIWEHLKLLYFPWLIFTVVEYFLIGKSLPAYWRVKLVGICAGLILIPVLFYTYTGALGIQFDLINIVIFFVTAAVVFFVETKLLSSNNARNIPTPVSISLLAIIAVIFWLMTFYPPHIPIFKDPMTGNYGYAVQ